MIQIQNLHFSYSNEVLSDISTKFEKGYIYGLLGPNGTGKTTLMEIICGMLRAKKGSTTIEGKESYKRTPDILSNIFYLPEHPAATISKIKTFAKEYGSFYPGFNYSQFEELMKEMRLDINGSFDKLSTGECKKAFIAFALALNTPYLLLDEPTNGLDITSKGEFRQIISRYMNEERCIVIATHQIKEVANLLDHITIIKDKQIAIDNSIVELQQKYRCGTANDKPSDALYCEECINGYNYIATNETGEESRIDIELLFNHINLNK